MQNLIPLIFIGFFIYLIFSRNGGMGCCGGHGAHRDQSSDKQNKSDSEPDSQMQDDKVIDLHEGKDYVFLHVKDDERRFR
jgi:hypothetical protein